MKYIKLSLKKILMRFKFINIPDKDIKVKGKIHQ